MISRQGFKIIPAILLLLVKKGCVFMMKRQNTEYEDGNRDLMSGHLELNESLTHAIIREAKEEIGIDVDIKNLELAHVLNRLSHD